MESLIEKSLRERTMVWRIWTLTFTSFGDFYPDDPFILIQFHTKWIKCIWHRSMWSVTCETDATNLMRLKWKIFQGTKKEGLLGPSESGATVSITYKLSERQTFNTKHKWWYFHCSLVKVMQFKQWITSIWPQFVCFGFDVDMFKLIQYSSIYCLN